MDLASIAPTARATFAGADASFGPRALAYVVDFVVQVALTYLAVIAAAVPIAVA